jgi:DtxR family Mn-dependent transcriptional regulator
MGARLTAAGEKLAGLVLRRHRIIELFLVRVLGMDWTEVHDEAERLEHAVSERLIERIDDMLGRPAVDPHGDPIPSPEGHVAPTDGVDLANVPLATRVRVARVIDQEPAFLRFIEGCDLTPGRAVTVESRDLASDAVRLVTESGRHVTIGTRAAAKVLVTTS